MIDLISPASGTRAATVPDSVISKFSPPAVFAFVVFNLALPVLLWTIIL